MKITVIGNGFDIRHGLKTKYSDFAEVYRTKMRTNAVFQYLLKIDNLNGWVDFENQIQDFLKHLSKLFSCVSMMSYKDSLYLDYSKFTSTFEESIFYDVITGQNYIFFSTSENSNTIKIVDSRWTTIFQDCIDDDIKELTKTLFTYLKGINKNHFNKIALLKSNDIDCIKNADKVFTFNYTSLTEKYIDKSKITYVHGNILESFDKLILGIPFTTEINLPRFHKYFKTNQSIALRKNQLIPLEDSNEISFIGFGFGTSDHYFFQEIKDFYDQYSTFNNAKIIYTFYFHNDESVHNFISNLRVFLGESKLVSIDVTNKISFIKLDEI